MTLSCRDCRYQAFRQMIGRDGDKQSLAWCGLHAVSSDYARMQWFRDRSNTIPSEENCGIDGRFWQERKL